MVQIKIDCYRSIQGLTMYLEVGERVVVTGAQL